MKRVIIILSGIGLVSFLFAVLISKTHNAQQVDDGHLIGSFQMTDSPATILTLHQGHMFTLENHINEKIYGDGNWETDIKDITRLTLDFENGESLTLKLMPEDNSLVSENIPNTKITLRRIEN